MKYISTYRPDIDGLRTVAVLSILLFHLSLWPFSGGFVGVDIFFVISGYLIGRSIVDDVKTGKFSILDFVERRARRLAAPFFVVIFFSIITAYILMLPNDIINFFSSLKSSLNFTSNIHFFYEINYFDVEAHNKPLLHIWSLSIEEQFYFIFPWIVIFSKKFKYRSIYLLTILLLSFFISIVFYCENSKMTFYFLPFRMWEFLLGTITYCIEEQSLLISDGLKEFITAFGVVLIIISIFYFSSLTPFPREAALVPCIGTALIIWSNKKNKTCVGWILARRPMTTVGKISYSVYLWHWPLIVFASYYLDRPLKIFDKLLIVITTFVLSALSYNFVEQPIRNRTIRFGRFENMIFAAIFCFIFYATAIFGIQKEGFPGRLSGRSNLYSNARNDWSSDQFNCVDKTPEQISNGDICIFGGRNPSSKKLLLWGDSHSTALLPVLKEIANQEDMNLTFIGTNGCPPIIDVETEHRNCKLTNEAATNRMRSEKYDVVIISANWQSYGKSNPITIANSNLSKSIEVVCNMVINSGAKPIIVGQVPAYSIDIPNYLAKKSFFGALDKFFSYTRKIPSPALDPMYLKLALQELPFVITLFPKDLMCHGKNCQIEVDGHALYKDGGHLSKTGSLFVLKNELSFVLQQAFLNQLNNHQLDADKVKACGLGFQH